MGLCASCRRPKRSQEREPLLPTTVKWEDLTPHKSRVNEVVNILAALNAGKLPSQDQVNRLLQKLLKSNIFHGDPGRCYGPLSESGCKVVADARELIEATLRIGTEKNHDDKLQDLIFHSASIDGNSVHIDAEVAADLSKEVLSEMQIKAAGAPTPTELTTDAAKLTYAIKCVTRLLLTSSAFRMIVYEVFSTVRDFVAGVAADVGDVAHQVQAGVEEAGVSVEELESKAKEVIAEVKCTGENIGKRWETLGQGASDSAKDVIVGRVQGVILQAHKNPEYHSALRTILLILQKYSQKLRSTTKTPQITVTPIVWTDPHMDHTLADLKILLERAASGLSLNPLLHAFLAVTTDIITPSQTGSEVTVYFSDLGDWLNLALEQPYFVTSIHGTRAAEHLYDAGCNLLASTSESNSKWAQDVRTLLNHADAFINALKSDNATVRFVHALNSLSSDLESFTRDVVTSGISAQRRRREELTKDVWGWFVPRILKSIRTIPMPRVEFQNDTLDVAVDALLFTAAGSPLEASLVPDRLTIQNWSEFDLETVPRFQDSSYERTEPRKRTETSSSSRVRLHMDGIRVSAHGIGYYVRYKGLINYSDEGLLSVDVGGRSVQGEGMSIDLVLETTSAEVTSEDVKQPFFRVVDVKTAVPGLRFSIDRSKHWILNKMVVQPLSGPMGRWIMGRMVEAQVRAGLEAVEKVLSGVADEVRKKTADTDGGVDSSASLFGEYWRALLENVPLIFLQKDDSHSEDPPEERSPTAETEVESHTIVGMKGIVHTTVAQPSNGDASETVLAIGGGAQLFPGKGGPYNEDEGIDLLDEVGRDVEEAVVGLAGKMTNAAEGVVKARDDLEGAKIRAKVTEREERHRRGWRSGVFDL